MNIWIKRGFLIAIIVGIATALYFAMRQQPIMVDSTVISASPMKVTIDADGVTRVRDVYTISSPIAGHLDRSALDEGQPVKAGETIVASIHPLDPPFLDQRTQSELTASIEAARSRVIVAEAEMDSARTALALATSEYERSAKLVDARLITESAIDHAYSDVELRKAQLASAKAMVQLRNAELASAKARLIQPLDLIVPPHAEDCCVELTAPINGVVLTINTRSEQAVIPGTKIAEVGNPDELEVAVDLISSDAARIRSNASAELIEWGGEVTLPATVRKIEPSAFTKISSLGIEEQRVNVILDIENPPSVLGHNYRVVVRLVVWSADSILQVPIGALFRSEGKWAVFVVQDEIARMKTIEVDHMNDSHAEITNGLLADETVILYPNDVLEDGSPVKSRE
jgi:HlyD family secretion protein